MNRERADAVATVESNEARQSVEVHVVKLPASLPTCEQPHVLLVQNGRVLRPAIDWIEVLIYQSLESLRFPSECQHKQRSADERDAT